MNRLFLIVKIGKAFIIALVKLAIFFLISGLIFSFIVNQVDYDDCYDAPSHGTNADSERKTVIVAARTESWTDSGLRLPAQKKLFIETGGTAKLCQGTVREGVTQHVFHTFPSIDHKWQATGVYVRQGARLELTTDNGYSQFANANCSNDTNPNYSYYKSNTTNERVFDDLDANDVTRIPHTGRWNDSGTSNLPCHSSNGKGLFVYIGELDNLDSNDFENPEFEGKDDRFFELFQYISSTDTNAPLFNMVDGELTMPHAPASGQIYLRYGEVDSTAPAETAEWQWPTETSAADNVGEYSVKIISNCEATNGQALIGYIGESAPEDQDNEGSFLNIDAALAFENGGFTKYETTSTAGKLFFKIVDTLETSNSPASGDGNYHNNSGQYTVTVSIYDYSMAAGNELLNKLIEPVKILLHGTTVDGVYRPGVPQAFFEAITVNGLFIQGLQACLVLAIALHAFNFVATNKGGSLQELITFAIRFGIIIALISEDSWSFFYDHLFKGLMGAIDQISVMFISAINPNMLGYSEAGLVASELSTYESNTVLEGIVQNQTGNSSGIIVGTGEEAKNVFSFLSGIIDFISNGANWFRLLSFFTHSLAGVGLVFVFIYSIILFFLTVYRTLLTYLSSTIFLAILIGMGPIFIGMILFSYTRRYANLWLRAILFYALNPIMLLALISIFAMMYFNFLHAIFNFAVCYDCVVRVGIPIFGGEWCVIANYTPWIAPGEGMLERSFNDMVSAIGLLVIATSMYKLPDLSYSFAYRLAGAPALPDTGSGKDSMGSQLGISEDKIEANATRALGAAASGAASGAAGRAAVSERIQKPSKQKDTKVEKPDNNTPSGSDT